MSVSALTSLAVVRERTAPQKRHLGKQSARKDDHASPASMLDLLVSSVPTELVAPYTAVTAVIVGSVAKATKTDPHPDHYGLWRWLVLAILVLATAGSVWAGARAKGSRRDVPVLEIASSVTAAIGWALALPNSPLTLVLDKGERTFVPAIVAFAATAVTAVMAMGLGDQTRRGAVDPSPGAAAAPDGEI